jgi:glutaredoxin
MREIQKYRYIMAAVLTVTVFAMGVLFSNLVDDRRYQSLQNEIQEDSVEMESRNLQLSYLKSSNVQSCSALKAGLSDIIQGYNDRLSNVQNYQDDSFFKENRFRTVKREYIISGIRYWMYAEEVKDKCDYNADTVLFFTENLFGDSSCDDCTRVGSELSILKKKHGEEFLLFSVPTSLNDGAVDMLEEQYNVTSTPTIVINGEKEFEGFNTSQEIEQKLNASVTER